MKSAQESRRFFSTMAVAKAFRSSQTLLMEGILSQRFVVKLHKFKKKILLILINLLASGGNYIRHFIHSSHSDKGIACTNLKSKKSIL